MPDDWASQFAAQAMARVNALVAEHPEYTCQGVPQPGQGSTNRVVFARRGKELVVFKVFCEVERKAREIFAFHHWRDRGLVPRLIADVDEYMLVMSHISGMYLHEFREIADEGDWRRACREAGEAIGGLTCVPLYADVQADFESRFYGDLGELGDYLSRILELGRQIHARDPDFRDAFWGDNLEFMASHLETILAQPRILYHQDVSNLHIHKGHFSGMFDLEMCRVGCAAMQLASAVGMFRGQESGWAAFLEGWAGDVQRPLISDDRQAAAAGACLLLWREISRYLSYDGTPGAGHVWAASADPVRYRSAVKSTLSMFGV